MLQAQLADEQAKVKQLSAQLAEARKHGDPERLAAQLQRVTRDLNELRLQGTPSRLVVEKSKMAEQMQRLRDELSEKEASRAQ